MKKDNECLHKKMNLVVEENKVMQEQMEGWEEERSQVRKDINHSKSKSPFVNFVKKSLAIS